MLILVLVALSAAPERSIFRPGEAEARWFQQAFERGESLFHQGDFGAAVANFLLADRLRVTSEVAFDLAKCHEKLGDLAFATYYYRLYLRRAPNASDTLDVAERIGRTLATAEAEGLGFLELDSPRASLLLVGGRSFPDGPVALFLPSGEYEVRAEFPVGHRAMSVRLKPGQAASYTFEPVPAPLVPTENALSAALIAQGYERPPAASPLRVGSYVLGGVGLAALAVGVALGALAASDSARLQNRPGLTVSQASALVDSANSKAMGANLLYGGGGASVVGAVVMFVLSLSGPSESAP